ncbi:MAG: tetraacyldisaccharide 4'-kinase [Flavobacteriales bacterium]
MNSGTRILLWPFGLLYGFAVWMRNKLFDLGILKSQKGDIPTIVIGNLSVGGTGKTPHTNYLVQHLNNKLRLAILSRGYGRKTEGFILASDTSTASEIGDEPLLLQLRNPQIPLAVCEDRLAGISQLKPRCRTSNW